MADEERSGVAHLNTLGIALIVLGLAGVLMPAVAGSAVVIAIGIILLIAGIVAIVRVRGPDSKTEKTIHLVLGVVTALAGVAVIARPFFGLAFLTLLLIGYFVTEGICKIVVSLRYRPANGWVWLLASGLLSFLLGALIWNQWPISGMWAVGILVGVNLLGTGLALVALASTLKRL